ncbi:MAG: transporter associated domain-containing protein, partial [Spirochaetota bacterium]
SIEVDAPVAELFSLIEKTHFSRIPVYRERVDNIIGYVYYRDIIEEEGKKIECISDIMRKPVYVPMTKTLYSLYTEMQKKKNHIVFVVTEHGAVAGVVTREDIAEEIVGEIQTRDHPREDLVTVISDNRYLVDGTTDVDFFARMFRIKIEKKGFETVGGMVCYLFGYIPEEQEKIDFEGLTLSVDSATERAVVRIMVTRTSRRRGRVTGKA